ncbi:MULTISPECIES: methyltransferase family protein [Acidithiobacillus]|uniref:Isoprenylcysteine carboxyl methyltransferase n=1 Tax=Acidithiobacillus thiooxidans TaxID=930 RepID=A0A1C2IAE5_ACITH|nr:MULTISPECIES: isoprenylcysteine carboxylmethyltransferase family protein [Acidithiobacillus]MBU2743374.1 isoprenylcysteine carboxylmethyltransferase family protein [Acidithiobacillus albertensis]OCX72927.1 isoprenylcysteine carboxyl methyltransferase [Acidithiobacillus thiooxidans]OCX87651.1 isoprenylcysteine carboxyl methyltransferase [Acidithiobacillus thiooxidans]
MIVLVVLLFALLSAWILLELYLEYFFRSPMNANKRDDGFSKIFNVVIVSSLGNWAYVLTMEIRHEPHIALHLPRVGVSLLAAGLMLRAYAIMTLKKYFTVDLAIQPGHRLIRHGPYRIMRHPSYTGALLCFFGLALSFGYWATAILIVAPITLVYFWRIIKEERILVDAFGIAYLEYRKCTYYLVPGII